MFDLSEATRHAVLFGTTGSGKTSSATTLFKHALTGGGSKILTSVKDPTDVEEIDDGS
jgi:type II secretory ATPase GspE/PulE/Tfp pilus assembly ATPase PilB-like protein